MAKTEGGETEQIAQAGVKKSGFRQRVKRLWSTKKGKALVVLLALLLVAGLMLAIPPVRDATFGQLIKKDLQVTVVDTALGRPVSDAVVRVDGQEAMTGSDGVATISSVRAILHEVAVSKPNYKEAMTNYTVPFFTTPEQVEVKLEATGQPVTITATDAITEEPLADVAISYGDATTRTDAKGQAILVLPYDESEQTGKAQKDGYVAQELSLKTDREQPELTATLTLTPDGTVMYLSKETGTINVMRANLDGSNDAVIVKGTGNETDYATVLLSTRDWKYGALLSRRDGKNDKLYLVEKESGKLTLIDEGDVVFNLTGWTGHKFVYDINRNNVEDWQPKSEALKVYDADAGTLKVVDETEAFTRQGGDYGRSTYAGTHILEDEIVYATTWYFSNRYGYEFYGNVTKNAQLVSVNPTNYASKVLKNFPEKDGDSLYTTLYEPQSVYIQVIKDGDYDNPTYFAYESGNKVEARSDLTPGKFRSVLPTYLLSPSGKQALWHEERNGKNTLFIGNKYGKDATEVADRSEFTPYGWFGGDDQYILLSKDNSELYVAVPEKLKEPEYTPLKISNYHKPRVNYPAFGYGYGGL